MSALDTFDRISRLLYRVVLSCSLCVAAVMTTLVFLQVMLRYIFNTGYPGIEEVALICMMWTAFFGGSLLFAEQSGISVTVLVERLAPAKYRWAKLVFHILTIVFLCLLVWYGYKFAVVGKRMMFGASQIPKFWSYLSIPVGSACSILFELNHLCRTLRAEDGSFLGETLEGQHLGEGG